MTTMHEPSRDHAVFDLLCEGLEDGSPLPNRGHPTPAEAAWLHDEPAPEEEAGETSLDAQILAGLVSPC